MESEREVIIVGAGPAGATTATALAQKGRDVLLLDRLEFPRDKACGDAVPVGAIAALRRLGMGEKIDNAVERGEFYPLKKMLLVSPKGYRLEAKFKEDGTSYVAPRIHFDSVIQKHAIESGAEFVQAHVKEPILENDQVVGVRTRSNGREKEFRSKVVIGADGVTSPVARALRTKTQRHVDAHRAVALRAYIDDIKEFPHMIEFYLYKGILPGYAWIFPTGENKANVGLGMRLDHFRKTKQRLEDMLKAFLEMPEIRGRFLNGGQLRDVATWQLNFGSQKKLRYVFDGALLVGDAAGFINPLTGGGIHNALISAELAAASVDEALERGDLSRRSLRKYERLCHDALWVSMTRSYRIQKWLMNFPFLVDFLVARLKENSTLAKTFLTKL
jgi:geranylgeranyl reductase family protein